MHALSSAPLASITTATVPTYDRAALKAGILHFGLGNFHRAHQAVYLNDLFQSGQGHDWAIIGASVREADAPIQQKLKGQHWLTTVVEQEADRASATITGAMIDYIAPGDTAAILARLRDPAIRIVSLTITEGGYYIDPATQAFDANHPDIAHDATHPDAPRTTFGLILAGLVHRRDNGIAPFTVMSCDNIPGNGHVTENAIAGLAEKIDPALARWVRDTVAFPNSMVDRITPATTERERDILARDFDIDDAWPVFCESFRQWVLEDQFPAGRPALEAVGVQFVPDVAPYEHMKIRILNGGHATIAYPASLLGIHFVHEAMEDEQIARFLAKVEADDIVPIVPPVPDTDLGAYFALCQRRFGNPKIGDTNRRLAHDGANRQPKFIIPSAADNLAAGRDAPGLALVSALWCRYCFGTTDAGAPVEPNDPSWDRLKETARQAKDDPQAWLAMRDIYGDVGANPRFAANFARALNSLWTNGVRATLESYLAGTL
ncbi:mannitol dehydrogenase family protein [Kaistia nematophila]|uniref:Mannitol dehydrogenase family protein n=1 Tax=Kaistia nematophila TaxID=2994654 RepID=A0A9X3E233_9HYPH|nr:mannitol dehydrogenase family protein [Kaistia nematophila]MCX5569967.1 mannitol dehydrogenase family protein [Kaistia nematophila]